MRRRDRAIVCLLALVGWGGATGQRYGLGPTIIRTVSSGSAGSGRRVIGTSSSFKNALNSALYGVSGSSVTTRTRMVTPAAFARIRMSLGSWPDTVGGIGLGRSICQPDITRPCRMWSANSAASGSSGWYKISPLAVGLSAKRPMSRLMSNLVHRGAFSNRSQPTNPSNLACLSRECSNRSFDLAMTELLSSRRSVSTLDARTSIHNSPATPTITRNPPHCRSCSLCCWITETNDLTTGINLKKYVTSGRYSITRPSTTAAVNPSVQWESRSDQSSSALRIALSSFIIPRRRRRSFGLITLTVWALGAF